MIAGDAGYIDASMVKIADGLALTAGTVRAFVQRYSDSFWLQADTTWNAVEPVAAAIPTMTHWKGGEWRLAHTPADANDVYSINCVDEPVTCYPDNRVESVRLAAAVEATLTRVLGLVLDNHVEDDIVRDANGLKTSSIIYCYDSAANAATHDKATGLAGQYAITVTYTARRMTTFKSARVA